MKRLIFPIIISMLLTTTACRDGDTLELENSKNTDETETISGSDEGVTSETTADESASEQISDVSEVESSDMFTNRDYEVGYQEEATYNITLSGNTAVSDSDSVVISGSTVTIKDEGTYIITGSLDDGMIIVDAEDTDKPQIVLNGANITSSTSAPIYVKAANKAFITLADGTENILSNGGVFEAIDENDIDGVIFSKQDITLNGSGSLEISSPAGHGIVGKDDIAITSGIYSISCLSHGVNANNSVRLANAEINIDSGNDGIHAEHSEDATLGFVYALSGSYTIDADGDGMSASSYMQIENGTFNIVSGGGSVNAEENSTDNFGGMGGGPGGMMGGGQGGMMNYGRGNGEAMLTSETTSTAEEETENTTVSTKGIKAAGSILINGASITVDSADDTIHSDGSVTVNGGDITLTSGDDGIHANETLTINDGNINITDSYEGLEALDIVIAGGDIDLTASDDGLNAAGGTDSSSFEGIGGGNDMFGGHGGMMGSGTASGGSVVISGGKLDINASGDGIDSNGTLEISGGDTTLCGPTNGDTAVLDYDTTGVITGGTFIGSGAYMMAQTFSSSEQGVIAVSVGEQAAGTKVTVSDSDGNVIIETEPELQFQIIIISCPELESGETYNLTVGEESAEITAG